MKNTNRTCMHFLRTILTILIIGNPLPAHSCDSPDDCIDRHSDTQYLIKFKASTVEKRFLEVLLKEASDGNIKMLKPNSLLNKNKVCDNNDCAIGDYDAVDALKKSALKSILPDFNVIGIRTTQHGVQGVARQDDKSGDGNRSMTSLAFTAINSNPAVNLIPTMGYQDLGTDFPATSLSLLTPQSAVKEIAYQINMYHTAPSNLMIYLGFDSTLTGGSMQMLDLIYNHPPGLPTTGLITLTGFSNTISQYFQYHNPNAYYFIRAENTVGTGSGYIESATFEVFWSDEPDLQAYTATGSTFFWNQVQPLLSQGYIDIDSTLLNASITDITTPFDVGWYITPASTCSITSVNTDPTDPNAYFVGSTTLPGLGAFDDAAVSMYNGDALLATNPQGNHPPTGQQYCIWSYTDNTNVISEVYENNNAYRMYGTFYLALVTDIKEARKAGRLTVSMDSTSENLLMNLPESFQTNQSTIEILNTSGQLVRSEKLTGNTPTVTKNVSELVSGIYLVNVKNEKSILTAKFVK